MKTVSDQNSYFLWERFQTHSITPSVAVCSALISSLCWTLFFCLMLLVATGRRKWLFPYTMRLLPLVHGIIIIVFTFVAMSNHPYPFFESGERNIPLHNLLLVVSVGFFIYDFFYVLISKSEPAIMVAHHVFSIIVLVGALIIQVGGAEMMIGMFLMESTNPLFQLRAMLRLSKYKDGMFYKIVEWTFVTLFTLVRVIACSVVFILAVSDPFTHLHIKICFTLFYILSLVMVYYTWVYITKKYCRKKKDF